MKNLLKVALVAICMLFMGNFAKAQSKIGYVAVEQIIQAMPEMKTVQTNINAYQQTFVDKYNSLTSEFQNKVKDYDAKKATMTDAVRIATENDLQDQQKRVNDYQNTASQQVDAKGQELMKPVIDKVKAAVAAVAKEKGYAYVINTSQTDLVVAPPADDLLAPVKVKLGIK